MYFILEVFSQTIIVIHQLTQFLEWKNEKKMGIHIL